MNHLLASEGGYQAFTLPSLEKGWLYFAPRYGSDLPSRLLPRPDAQRARSRPGHNADERDRLPRIQEGAEAFLRRQFRAIAIIVVPLAALRLCDGNQGRQTHAPPRSRLSLRNRASTGRSPSCWAPAFSGLTGFIGMSLSVRGNVRTAAAALGAARWKAP